MNLFLEEFIHDIHYDAFEPESGRDYAIYLAREESPIWSSHCVWDAWEIEPDVYCVTKLSLLP